MGATFPTWDALKKQLLRVFAPPNQAYRVRSRFLSARQGKKELSDYVQELRTLIAAMQLDSLRESVLVTIFVEGLHTGVARTEAFRVDPSTFEEAVAIALNAEHNFKASRYGTNGNQPSASHRAEPMDLIHAESSEAELQAVEQRQLIRRCYASGSTRYLRTACPLRKPRQTQPSRLPTSNQQVGTVRENVDSQ